MQSFGSWRFHRSLALAVGGVLLGGLLSCSSDTKPPGDPRMTGDPATPSLIVDENARAGDAGWRIENAGADDQLAAYARPLTLRAGEHIDIQIAAGAPSTVKWAIYRIGAYHGAGGRRMAEGTAAVGPQAEPFVDATTGLVECRWKPSFGLDLPRDWVAGYYLARVEAADGGARYAPFIVKDDRKVDVLAVFPTSTEAAYNTWGGESLYSDSRFHFPVGHAYQVSYDRPFADGAGGGFMSSTAVPALRYLEANGYDVSPVGDHDIAADPSLLKRARLVITLAHDEYWTRSMRDGYEAARDGGVSLAFLGANTAYWQMRLDPAWDGLPARRQTAYKEAEDLDPLRHLDDKNVTGAFRDVLLGRPENALLGIMSIDWHTVDFPWVIKTGGAGAWVYGGMGASDGDLIPGVVGIETDGLVMNGAAPAGLAVVADSPDIGGDTVALNHHQATVYETHQGSFVFAAGSIRFPYLLSGSVAQVGAQRILRNLVAHAGGKPGLPEDTVGAQDGFASADVSRAASQVSTLAGRPGAPGYSDGPGALAQLNSPTGLALAPDGSLIVADASNHCIRRVQTTGDHSVSTVAGAPAMGDADGTGSQARFGAPFGVAVTADGTIWVTEPQKARVRRIDVSGAVTTLSGFREPAGIAAAPDGTVYVTDILDGSVHAIRQGSVTLVSITHEPDGPMNYPTGIAVEGDHLWMLDSGNRRVVRLDADGTLRNLGGSSDVGFADGAGERARMEPLLGVATVGGQVLFADSGNYRLRVLEPGADVRSSTVRTLAGAPRMGHADGPGASAELIAPTGLAAAPDGTVYVSDTGNATIRALRR